MLRPQYTRRPFELMVIGPEYSGKRTLAAQLLKNRNVFFQINTVSNIPKRELNRVDYILVVVDMTNQGCLDLLKESLNRIHDVYLTHKLAIVITKVDMPEYWTMSKRDIETIIQPFPSIQMFHVNLTNHSERKAIAEQITRLVQINTLQFSNLDIDYIKSHEFYRIEE